MPYRKPSPTAAPRLRAYIRGIEGAILMLRADWEILIARGGELFELDINDTPFFNMALDTDVVGCFAERLSENQSQIVIFRYDPGDGLGEKINTYRHTVFGAFSKRPDFDEVIRKASTSDDEVMQKILAEYVIIVPEEKSQDHHLPNIPGKYQIVIEVNRRTETK